MKKIVSILLLSCLATIAFAVAPKHVSVNVDLTYQQKDQTGTLAQYLVTNTLKIAANNHLWTTIHDKPNDNADQLVLLSKIENADAKQLTLKFIVLDTSAKPVIISVPQMVVRYGQKGQITLDAKTHKLQLDVLAVAN